MTTTIFGIKNCDTVKKARRWLSDRNIEHEFLDFREQPLSEQELQNWLHIAGVGRVLNKRSTSFRKLSPEQQGFSTEQQWLPLLQQQPTLIKRPVLKHKGSLHFGFKAEQYEEIFA
ncbi:arsenate reductase [Aliidiomarina minuta]|uniref:Arsenate reductase n=1 Tax=Aliidiomarina minuta TaxID=880057 RepID=A0A432W6P9_9GAMM|nr:Spx/MgsR family RNA polymerase-binding regulatory protein [Aliidiomarina minuta]RUO25748.1 arsenate reductase [Aliidiomarina minuta]